MKCRQCLITSETRSDPMGGFFLSGEIQVGHAIPQVAVGDTPASPSLLCASQTALHHHGVFLICDLLTFLGSLRITLGPWVTGTLKATFLGFCENSFKIMKTAFSWNKPLIFILAVKVFF